MHCLCLVHDVLLDGLFIGSLVPSFIGSLRLLSTPRRRFGALAVNAEKAGELSGKGWPAWSAASTCGAIRHR